MHCPPPYWGNVAALGGSGTDSDALLWKAAVVAAGGTVSDARLALVSTLIISQKASGVWFLLDRQWLLAAENSQSALIDLVARSTATAVNSPTFTVDRGYAGNPGASWVTSNYTPSIDAVALSQNSAHISAYTTDASDTQAVVGAGASGGNHLHMYCPFSDGNMYARINNLDGQGGPQGSGLTTGMFLADRTGVATVLNYHNEVLQGTDTPTSTGLAGFPLFIAGGLDLGGTIDATSGRRFGAFSAGGSLGAAGDIALPHAINAYMTSIGANVY